MNALVHYPPLDLLPDTSDSLRGELRPDEALREFEDDALLQMGLDFTEQAERLIYMRARAALEYARRGGEQQSARVARLTAFALHCRIGYQVLLAELRIVRVIPEETARQYPELTRGHFRAAVELTSRAGEPLDAPERQQRAAAALEAAANGEERVRETQQRLLAEKQQAEAAIYQQTDGSEVLSPPEPGTTAEIIRRLETLEGDWKRLRAFFEPQQLERKILAVLRKQRPGSDTVTAQVVAEWLADALKERGVL